MEDLNLRHLFYFWKIAREGSIVKAAERLDLAPQTLSGQLATFEASVGGTLFKRAQRKLSLTDFGRTVFSYADDMFQTAQALSDVLHQPPENRPLSLAVGIAASIHKNIAYHLIEPVLSMSREVSLSCRTGFPPSLLNALGRRELDVVILDRQPESADAANFRTHRLASSPISLFAAPDLAAKLKSGFPGSLDRQPFLAASLNAPYVTELMNWFSAKNVRVKVVGQVDDSALIKVFGRRGLGYFAAPSVIEEEVCRQYQVEHVGRIEEVQETLYAITRARGAHTPAVEEMIRERPDFSDLLA